MHCGLSRLTSPWIVPNAKSKMVLLLLKKSIGEILDSFSSSFQRLYLRRPIKCWKITQQFPSKTIQFCTTLNEGGGETSIEDIKSANLPNGFVYDCTCRHTTVKWFIQFF